MPLRSILEILLFALYHGTIKQTGITCKKIFWYVRWWIIFENVIMFRSYVKSF